MIERLRGEIVAKGPEGVVVSVAGVGFLLDVSSVTLRDLPAVGAEGSVFTHLHVREDAMQLFGFSTEEERELFRMFLSVSKIGPKLALAALSCRRAPELKRALGSGDVALFASIPGIGRKTAERIILELREKMGDAGAAGRIISAEDDEGAADTVMVARSALVELGYTVLEADRLLSTLDPELPVEELVRKALGEVLVTSDDARAMDDIDTEGANGEGERLADPEVVTQEQDLERTLRPRSLESFVGQPMLREQLQIFIEAASSRGESLDHVLLAGPPGLGKTTLANIIALEMRVNIVTTSGPALERKADMAAILTHLQEGDVLFIDEIHRLNRAIEEILYPAMEDFEIDIIIGQGPSARTIRLELPRFTLIGATTRSGLITTPLRDRFGFSHRLDYYSMDDLALIVKRSAEILGVDIDDQGAGELALRSRGTPRIANRLLKRVRDFAQVRHQGDITADIALEALHLFEVDDEGLDRVDREILTLILHKFDGGPVGLSTLAVAIGEEPDTIEDVYEPFLLQRGFLMRTPRGRVLTRLGYQHCGVEPPTAARSIEPDKLFP